MISQSNTDYISWSQFLKGNYRKGIKRLESILNNPLQATDFIEDKAALAVIFGNHDKQTVGLLDVVANSRYADVMAKNFIATVASTDENFIGAATDQMINNVCSVSANVGETIAKRFWKNDTHQVIGQGSDKMLDVLAANLQHIDPDDFSNNIRLADLSRLSTLIGKKDKSKYAHLLGCELSLGITEMRSSNVGTMGRCKNDRYNPDLKMKFVVVGVNCDKDENGNDVGFTLMSKYPLRFADMGDYSPINYFMSYNYFDSDYEEDPDSRNSSYSYYSNANSASYAPRAIDYYYRPNSSESTYYPMFRGDIDDYARPAERLWTTFSYRYVYNRYKTTDAVQHKSVQRFWTPSIGNIFGDQAASKFGKKYFTMGNTTQYDWFKDFSNFNGSVLNPAKCYNFNKVYDSDGPYTFYFEEKAFSKGSNDIFSNSSYMLNVDAATANAYTTNDDNGMLKMPIISSSGTVSFPSSSTNRGAQGSNTSYRAYFPNIFMCI